MCTNCLYMYAKDEQKLLTTAMDNPGCCSMADDDHRQLTLLTLYHYISVYIKGQNYFQFIVFFNEFFVF